MSHNTTRLVAIFIAHAALSACHDGGGGGGGDTTSTVTPSSYTVSASAGANGNIAPANANVNHGATTSFTVTPDAGYSIAGVTGCGGSLTGNTYTTGAITADCTVSASFALNTYTVSTSAGTGGVISPASASVNHGATTNFTITPDAGHSISAVSGCGGTLAGNTYTTGAITADCTVSASFIGVLNLSFQPIKTFRFTWTDMAGMAYYKLLENPDGVSGFTQVGTDIPQGTQTVDHIVPLYARINAQYILQACDSGNTCTDYLSTSVSGTMDAAIGYFKARTYRVSDNFGYAVAISGDGTTLAVGAKNEASNATGINGAETDNSGILSGAVYVFVRDAAGAWSRQAYLKASTQQNGAYFGWSVDLSDDGNTLVVGTPGANYPAYPNSGAAHIFTRSGTTWIQQAVLQASNAASSDEFGTTVAISGDGNTVAVFAAKEDSGATGTYGSAGQITDAAQVAAAQADNSVSESGAVYVFTRSGITWNQDVYIKASNTGQSVEWFGKALALNGNGTLLAVGAPYEDSNADGINGGAAAEADNSAGDAGAAYVFALSGGVWSQTAYIKATNSGAGDEFGWSLALSADGNTLAVGARKESSSAIGIDGDQTLNNQAQAGAVYVFSFDNVTSTWSQQAYVKASNTPGNGAWFGDAVALSADGNRLAVGHPGELKGVTGVDGDQTAGNLITGAVYIFLRSGGNWFQQAFLKAPNPDYNDRFGHALDLNANGDTLAVGAYQEDSGAEDIGGNQADNGMSDSGAVYLY